jgi:hypothetical protein
MILDISIGSIFAAVIPHELRARVSGAYRTLNYGIRPLGALTGGALGTAVGLRTTLWISALGALLCVLWVLPGPLRRLRTLPAAALPAAALPAATLPAAALPAAAVADAAVGAGPPSGAGDDEAPVTAPSSRPSVSA